MFSIFQLHNPTDKIPVAVLCDIYRSQNAIFYNAHSTLILHCLETDIRKYNNSFFFFRNNDILFSFNSPFKN
jgi:aspartyl/asparaginyl beta-hydroxylase (cupin superfamily)